MKTHQEIDQRSLAMARAIVQKIDVDPDRKGLQKARVTCRRWHDNHPSAATGEWLELLAEPWPEIRCFLLDESETGARLRQNSPFAGVLTPAERWAIYRKFSDHDTSTT